MGKEAHKRTSRWWKRHRINAHSYALYQVWALFQTPALLTIGLAGGGASR